MFPNQCLEKGEVVNSLGGISTPKPAWHLLPSRATGSRPAPSATGDTVLSEGIFPSLTLVEKPSLVVTVGWQSAEITPGSHTSAGNSTEEAEPVGGWPWEG